MREKLFCRLCLVILLALLIRTVHAPVGAQLADENRAYTAFSIAEADAYFTDRLPMREHLLRLYRDVSLALGKRVFAGAFLGRDGYIFSAEETNAATLAKNLEAIASFADTQDIPVYTAIVGAKTDVLLGSLPPLYADDRESLWQCLQKSGLQTVDLLPVLRRVGAEGKYIYYRGDHHLTSLGSYYTYREIAEALGVTPYGAKDFSVGVVKNDFSGSEARKMLHPTMDKIALFRYRGDGEYLVENLDSGDCIRGLYCEEKLHSADPYGVFPIADCGRARITLAGAKRQKLLLFCDSYGDALAPFLARHYDLDLVDVRYFGGSVRELAAREDYAAVLVYFGMDTVATKEVLYTLQF